MAIATVPGDLEAALDEAWQKARVVPGYLGENEARFLGLLAACAPGEGAIVEIGSFKGRSTVMLASVAARYGLPPVVAIDPHNSPMLLDTKTNPEASSYQDFLQSIAAAGLSSHVEPHRDYSSSVAQSWNQPIRVLWIDGDHSYDAAKQDLHNFLPHVAPFGIVAFHDALSEFPGPIRVFVEDVLRCENFGPAGFVHSIAWAQFRPKDGAAFRAQRAWLERRAARLIPFVQREGEPRGLAKIRWKLHRSRIPRSPIQPADWLSLVANSPSPPTGNARGGAIISSDGTRPSLRNDG